MMAAPRRFYSSFFAALSKMARTLAAPNAFLRAAFLLQVFATVVTVASATPAGAPPHPMVLGASTTQNNITITQNFSSVYYVDTKTAPFPTGFYAVYNITNNS